MDEASVGNRYAEYLEWRARRIAAVYLAETRPRAMLLTGSVVKGDCDEYSDIDLIAYYDQLPSDEDLARARAGIDGAVFRPLGPRDDDSVLDTFTIEGIECQVGHMRVARIERDIAQVLDDLALDPVLHKSLIGLQQGIALQGDDPIGRWQARLAAFPDELARAMVAHYLGQIFAPWYFQESLARRDTLLWQRELIVQCAQSLLGALAGLNRRYYSTFQFKRLRQLTASLPLAPPDLAERIELLLAQPWPVAVELAEALTRETVDLVDQHLPGAETAAIRGLLGLRQQPWTLPPGWRSGAE